MSPLEFLDYKKYLRAVVAARDVRGTMKALAEAAGCQRPYLSRVLNDHVHLIPDHIYGIATYLRLGKEETRFLLLLLERDRAAQKLYRDHLTEQIKELRQIHERQQKQADKQTGPQISEADALQYYSQWYYPVIHIAVSVPNLQTIAALATHLQLSQSTVAEVLSFLVRLGFVNEKSGRWSWAQGHFHTDNASLFTKLLQSSLRQLAVQDTHLREHGSLHYSVVQTMSRSDFEKLRDQLLSYVEEFNKTAGPSRPEEVVVFNCDFFAPSPG